MDEAEGDLSRADVPGHGQVAAPPANRIFGLGRHLVNKDSTMPEVGSSPSLPLGAFTIKELPKPDSITSVAKHLSAQACYDRAEALFHGTQAMPVNRDDAALWYEQAAGKGLPAGMFAFAEALRWGDGVMRDPERAATFYRKAAESGELRAIRWMAHAYAVGDGVPRDFVEASKWEQKASAPSRFSLTLALAWLLLGAVIAILGYRWWLSRG